MAHRVFVLAGQSNMKGSGVSSEIPSEFRGHPDNLKLWVDGEELRIGQYDTFGPEVSFSHLVCREFPGDEVLVVKHAVGATSLLAWSPEWTEEKAAITGNQEAGPLYSRLMEYYRSADIPLDAHLEAVLWMQGERDAKIREAGKDYLMNLTDLVAHFRESLGREDAPFILGQVNPPEDQWPAYHIVRQAQEMAAEQIEHTSLVTTEGLSKLPDNLHYDSNGLIELGKRFFVAYQEV